MKLYLHKPRQNETVTLSGISFVEGVAEFDGERVPVSLEKYYNVRDYPMGSEPKKEEVEAEDSTYYPQERSKEELERIEQDRKLNNYVEMKKQGITEKKEVDWKELPFAKMKKYVETATGIAPKSKREAFAIMGEKL